MTPDDSAVVCALCFRICHTVACCQNLFSNQVNLDECRSLSQMTTWRIHRGTSWSHLQNLSETFSMWRLFQQMSTVLN